MPESLDILGLGVVTVDDFLFVPEYPLPEKKVRVTRRDRQCGGLTGTALVAAARLGARCAYAGTLGDCEISRFILAALDREGIDTRHVVRREGPGALHSTVVVNETRRTRTIFYQVTPAAGADEAAPPEKVIRSAKVLFVDQYGIPGMLRAAAIARSCGAAVVADFEHGDRPRFAELLALVDHLIVPLHFARELSDVADPAEAARALWLKGMDTLVVTCGAEGAWFVHKSSPREARHIPAFVVDTIDTTGCGNVFHGAYAAALAKGMPVEERLRLASASAALKSTKPGGQRGAPTLDAVEKFLAGRA